MTILSHLGEQCQVRNNLEKILGLGQLSDSENEVVSGSMCAITLGS